MYGCPSYQNTMFCTCSTVIYNALIWACCCWSSCIVCNSRVVYWTSCAICSTLFDVVLIHSRSAVLNFWNWLFLQTSILSFCFWLLSFLWSSHSSLWFSMLVGVLHVLQFLHHCSYLCLLIDLVSRPGFDLFSCPWPSFPLQFSFQVLWQVSLEYLVLVCSLAALLVVACFFLFASISSKAVVSGTDMLTLLHNLVSGYWLIVLLCLMLRSSKLLLGWTSFVVPSLNSWVLPVL